MTVVRRGTIPSFVLGLWNSAEINDTNQLGTPPPNHIYIPTNLHKDSLEMALSQKNFEKSYTRFSATWRRPAAFPELCLKAESRSKTSNHQGKQCKCIVWFICFHQCLTMFVVFDTLMVCVCFRCYTHPIT